MSAKSISREQLLQLHRDVTEKAREIMTTKNQDYAHEGDVFRNFRYFGGLGILVRLSDKLARLRSFEENGTFAVADEKLLDTIIDTVNYAVIYLAYKQEERQEDRADNIKGIQIKDGPECSRCEKSASYEVLQRNKLGELKSFLCDNCLGASEEPFDIVWPLAKI